MADVTQATQARSDQTNADDLIAGPLTVTITGEDFDASREQPLWLYLDNDQERPWKPCKTVIRLLVCLYGKESTDYIGKRLTIYRDSEVTYGGSKLGGIRISHASGIAETRRYMLAKTRGKKQEHVIQPLTDEVAKPAAKTWSDWFTTADITADQLKAWLDAVGMPPLSAMDEDTRGEVFANPKKYGDLVRGAK